MAILQQQLLELCPVNMFRPTFSDALSATSRAVMADIYNEAISRDPDEFDRNLRAVYSLDSDVKLPVHDYDHMLEYYSKVLSKRTLSFSSLIEFNLQGCVWRTSPTLYSKLQHSFHGVDGDASYTWTTVLCTATLLMSCVAASVKVSTSYTLQFAYSIATLVIYNTYFMFTRSGEYLVTLVAIHVLTIGLFCYLKPRKPSLESSSEGASQRFVNMVVCLRGIIMIATIIAILAYDNVHFNRRCSKTFFNGFSSMDVGCGFMIVHSGCMTSLSRNTTKRTVLNIIKRNWALFLLGIIRLLATAAVDYDVPVEEYGVHWNFFMSLGVTKILSELLLSVLPESMVIPVPLCILVLFEYFLHRFDMIRLLPSIPRTNVLTANKEGIIAIPNSITLFFIGYLIVKWCAKRYKEHRRGSVLTAVFCSSACPLVASIALYMLGFTSSRTLANFRFVMNTVAIVFIAFLPVVLWDRIDDGLIYPEMLRCIGKHSFTFFMLANVFTGAVNVFVGPLLLPFAVMYAVVAVYAVICCLFTLFMERRKISTLN